MRRALLVALVVALAAPAAAHAQDDAVERAVAGLRAAPVYVHPDASPGLTESERGRVQVRIARRATGRIKVALLPGSAAERAGSAEALAREIDGRLGGVRGTLVVVAGRSVHAITSYPQSERAVAAIRRGFRGRDSRVRQLVATVDELAAVDPGRAGDVDSLQRGQAPGGGDDQPGDAAPGGGSTPESTPIAGGDDVVDDFLDPILDVFRLAALIVAAAIALPFLVLAVVLVRRQRRRAGEEADAVADARADARDALVALGDDLRELDLDVSIPGANEAGVAYYRNALAAYERGDRELQRADGPRRIARAQAEIAEGRRLVAAARALLAGPPAAATGERRES